MRLSKKIELLAMIIEGQRKWITSRGGDLTGYAERFPNHPDRAERLYRVDTTTLNTFENELERINARLRRSH